MVWELFFDLWWWCSDSWWVFELFSDSWLIGNCVLMHGGFRDIFLVMLCWELLFYSCLDVIFILFIAGFELFSSDLWWVGNCILICVGLGFFSIMAGLKLSSD